MPIDSGDQGGGEQIVLPAAPTFVNSIDSGGEEIVSSRRARQTVKIARTARAWSIPAAKLEGIIYIATGGALVLNAGAEVFGPIYFGGLRRALEIDGTTMPTVTISGFALGDTIDLPAIPFDASGVANHEGGNVLQIFENGVPYYLQFDPSQNFAGEQFMLSADPFNGTEVTLGTKGSERDRRPGHP